MCTQWCMRKYALIEHSITTQNLNLLSTQDWVLNNHLFLLGNWVLNNPKIEWTLPHGAHRHLGFPNPVQQSDLEDDN